MPDREKMLLDALKKMTWQYPVNNNGILYDLLASDEGTARHRAAVRPTRWRA